MRRIYLLLTVLLCCSLCACGQNAYKKSEIMPTEYIDIIGENGKDVNVKEQYYNVYGNKMALTIAGKDSVVTGYYFKYQLLGPSVDDCMMIKDIYAHLVEDYGSQSLGTGYSNFTEKDVDVTSNETYWNLDDGNELVLRYSVSQKDPTKELEATGVLTISIFVRQPSN